MKRLFILQLVIIMVCAWAVGEFAVNFPYPSPLIRQLLPPRAHWPAEQIQGWVDVQSFPGSFLEYFGRDPDRAVPPGENMVAPADGVVVNQFYRDNVTYLVIGMSFWDVHVIRAPAAGIITDIASEGIRLTRENETPEQKAADIYERGKDAPVQKIVTLQSAFGTLKVHIITSYWASRIKVWTFLGEKIKKGDRIGRILLGSTTVLEVPGKVTFSLDPGQHVTGGESIIYRVKE